jgi:predicted small metal-binding protein
MIRMIKELRCADVFTGCAHVEQGHDVRALMRGFLIHVRDTHHVEMPTPALRIQAMTAVREVQAQIE